MIFYVDCWTVDDTGAKICTSFVFDDDSNSLSDARTVAKAIFYLSKLYPEAPQLDLVVQPAKELNHAFRQPACQITCKCENAK